MSKWFTVKEAIELSKYKRSTIIDSIKSGAIKKNSAPKRKNGIEINTQSFKKWLSGRKRIEGSCDSLYTVKPIKVGYFLASKVRDFSDNPDGCLFDKEELVKLTKELGVKKLYVDKPNSRKKRTELIDFISSCQDQGILFVEEQDHLGDSDFLHCLKSVIHLAGWEIDYVVNDFPKKKPSKSGDPARDVILKQENQISEDCKREYNKDIVSLAKKGRIQRVPHETNH